MSNTPEESFFRKNLMNSNKQTQAKFQTKFKAIDRATMGGGKKGELWVISGDTGDYKSTFTYNLLVNFACQGFKTLYVSSQKQPGTIGAYLACIHSADPKWLRQPLEINKVRDGSDPRLMNHFKTVKNDFANVSKSVSIECSGKFGRPNQRFSVSDIPTRYDIVIIDGAIDKDSLKECKDFAEKGHLVIITQWAEDLDDNNSSWIDTLIRLRHHANRLNVAIKKPPNWDLPCFDADFSPECRYIRDRVVTTNAAHSPSSGLSGFYLEQKSAHL